MKQQSEHLSNAQIEQYGKRASGAGPETEAWVETHLDDCPSCRSRVLDFQRTRLALLPDPKVNKASTSDCSSEDDLRNLAAGLCPDPKAAQLKTHAATCDRCGPLLQEYIEDFSDESSPEEQAFLDQLRTASPEFREQKALEMLKPDMLKKNPVTPGPVPATDWRRFFSWKWATAPALATVFAMIALGGVAGILYSRRDTPKKAEKYLAQAYTEQRTMEIRWPGAEWGPVSNILGDETTPKPLPLLEADEIIGRREKQSQDADWIRVLAERKIIDGDLQAAITLLDGDLRAHPDSVPLLQVLAIAYFQLGERSHERQDYQKADETLSEILRREPGNRVALFNRALSYERLNALDQAEEEWKAFLRAEKEEHWSGEAKKRSEELHKLK